MRGMIIKLAIPYLSRIILNNAGPSGRAVYGVGLLPLACGDFEFESHRGAWYVCLL